MIQGNAIIVYPDASTRTDGAVAIGLLIRNYRTDHIIKVACRINNNTTVLKAEQFAIYYGLLMTTNMDIYTYMSADIQWILSEQ